jgi:hypothetical protein
MLVATPNLLELLEPGVEKTCPLAGRAQMAVRQKETAKTDHDRRRSIKPPFQKPRGEQDTKTQDPIIGSSHPGGN